MSELMNLRMPTTFIVMADIIIAKGKVLKNRTGATVTFPEQLPTPELEIAIRDGKVIWSNIEVDNA